MNFMQYKKQAEADGMNVTNSTKKADIDAFYEGKETVEAVAKPVEVVKEESGCPHKIKGEDAFEFVRIQAFRKEKKPGQNKGDLFYMKEYICHLCGEREYRED